MDEDLLVSEIGDEDFFEEVADWEPDEKSGVRTTIDKEMKQARATRKKAPAIPGRKTTRRTKK
jgi:hypothetical protein